MFGYVKIHKPELKVKEYEQYKAVYCTLCKKLGKIYGHSVRMTLSYDFAFLSMLLLNLSNQSVCFKKGKCVYNPFKKCTYTECDAKVDEIYSFVSATAVIMLYFKLTDDIRDKAAFNRLTSRLFRCIIKNKYKKAALNYPDINEILLSMNSEQIGAEIQNNDIDIVCEPSANALGKICELAAGDDNKRVLYRIGYCVGKWVYLADALDDLEDDLKHNRFNAIKDMNIDDVVSNLNVCSNEAGAAFELLNENVFSNTIRNILYLGLPTEIKRIKEKKNERSV